MSSSSENEKHFMIVEGARTHNLKNVSVKIPKGKFVVFTGPSGSGKSSLAHDTLYNESHRQLLETFSSFQRQRLPTPPSPDFDRLANLQAGIFDIAFFNEITLYLIQGVLIKQDRIGGSWRSVLGTASGIYDLIRVLFSRCGVPRIGTSSYFSFNLIEGMCEKCQGLGKSLDVDIDALLDYEKTLADGAILFPDFKIGGWYSRTINGCNLFKVDVPLKEWKEEDINKLLYSPKILIEDHELNKLFQQKFEGIVVGIKRRYLIRENEIEGSGSRSRFFKVVSCSDCHGSRLNERARSVKVHGKTIHEIVNMELVDLLTWIDTVLPSSVGGSGGGGGVESGESSIQIASVQSQDASAATAELPEQILNRIRHRVQHLCNLGVGYLHLDRQTSSLSGGEAQRVKISKQLDCMLSEMAYYLDEPSQSLHMRDISALNRILRSICDRGNTVICVEHEPTVINEADYIVELGPAAGPHGGEIIFCGSVDELKELEKAGKGTPTSRALQSISSLIPGIGSVASASPSARVMQKRRIPNVFFSIPPRQINNLKNCTPHIPLNCLVVVSGVAGSGKSTLVMESFVKYVSGVTPIVIDQHRIGRSSRSNVATFCGVFDSIRSLFAKKTGKSKTLFSFNVKSQDDSTSSAAGGGAAAAVVAGAGEGAGDETTTTNTKKSKGKKQGASGGGGGGGCPRCKGTGYINVEMSFLEDITLKCEECNGRRYISEILDLKWRNKSIADVLDMSVEEAMAYFNLDDAICTSIRAHLRNLMDVGLGYLTLGQSLPSVSGGELQRLKVSLHLLKTKGDFFILDEPTSGLAHSDVLVLLELLNRLVESGNSVLVIEHNLDIIKNADWLIDLGPGGGTKGGEVVCEGPPEDIVMCKESITGRFLRDVCFADSDYGIRGGDILSRASILTLRDVPLFDVSASSSSGSASVDVSADVGMNVQGKRKRAGKGKRKKEEEEEEEEFELGSELDSESGSELDELVIGSRSGKKKLKR